VSETSKIEWTDATFNPWIGCTRVSPACDHCYAAVSTPARALGIEWGAGNARRRTSPANWKQPLRWNQREYFQCRCGRRGEFHDFASHADCPLRPTRRRVFCASLADVFDNEVDPTWRRDLFELIRATPNLDWLLLTKRIGNVRGMLEHLKLHAARYELEWRFFDDWLAGRPPANVWLGATICNQAEADRDVIKLLRMPASIRFLSMEPLLGPVRLWKLGALDYEEDSIGAEVYALSGTRAVPDCDWKSTRLDWVIAGGESGGDARPTHPAWVRSLRDQCANAGVPFLFKQWGEWAPYDRSRVDWAVPGACDAPLSRIGKKLAGRRLDGVLHDGYPEAA